jgi:putative spermidine/putrescine transport system permease protein
MTPLLRADQVWPHLRAVVCGAIVIFLIAPMVIVAIVSFSSAQFLTFPPPGFSLQWYQKLFSVPVWIDALSTSAMVMIPSALIASVVGTAAAVGLARSQFPGAGLIAGLVMAPMVVPVIITAAAMLAIFRKWGLQGTISGLVLAHATLAIPFVFFTVPEAGRRRARKGGDDTWRHALACILADHVPVDPARHPFGASLCNGCLF